MIDTESYKQIVLEDKYLSILKRYEIQFDALNYKNNEQGLKSKLTKAELKEEIENLIHELKTIEINFMIENFKEEK